MTTWIKAKRVNRKLRKKNKNKFGKKQKTHTNPNRS